MSLYRQIFLFVLCYTWLTESYGQESTVAPSTDDLSFLVGEWEVTRIYGPETDNPRTLLGRLTCSNDLDGQFINCLYEMERPGQLQALDQVYFNYNPIYKAYESLWLSSTWPIKVLMKGELRSSGDSVSLETTAEFEIENGIIEFVKDEMIISDREAREFSRKTHVRTSDSPANEWYYHMLETAEKIGTEND